MRPDPYDANAVALWPDLISAVSIVSSIVSTHAWELLPLASLADSHNILVDRDMATLLVWLIRSLLVCTVTCPSRPMAATSQIPLISISFFCCVTPLSVGKGCLMRLLGKSFFYANLYAVISQSLVTESKLVHRSTPLNECSRV